MIKRHCQYKYLIAGLLLFGLAGCGNGASADSSDTSDRPPADSELPFAESTATDPTAATEAPNKSETLLTAPDATQEPLPTPKADPYTWQGAYVEYVEGEGNYFSEYSNTYSLIYVDEDDIPELVIDSGGEATGCLLLTWHEGKLDWLQTDRLEFTYLERQNLLCNGSGNTGSYYDLVYTIQDGNWVQIADGEFWETYYDEETANIYFAYSWNGEEVSEEEYNEQLDAIFDRKKAVKPEQYYIFQDMRYLLLTGEVSSAGHRYEFIPGDVTWAEADALCKQRGGYLATITSQEEFARIESQLLEKNLTELVFWVGAYNPRDPFGYQWMEPGREPYKMLDYYNALFQFWQIGHPDYTMTTPTGDKIWADAVYLFYDSLEESCFLRDMPDDPEDWGVEYKGTVGYICEYDS